MLQFLFPNQEEDKEETVEVIPKGEKIEESSDFPVSSQL
jgi:hypothetical protein